MQDTLGNQERASSKTKDVHNVIQEQQIRDLTRRKNPLPISPLTEVCTASEEASLCFPKSRFRHQQSNQGSTARETDPYVHRGVVYPHESGAGSSRGQSTALHTHATEDVLTERQCQAASAPLTQHQRRSSGSSGATAPPAPPAPRLLRRHGSSGATAPPAPPLLRRQRSSGATGPPAPPLLRRHRSSGATAPPAPTLTTHTANRDSIEESSLPRTSRLPQPCIATEQFLHIIP